MSEILGHDVNGRPLRAGDRVAYVGLASDAKDNGLVVRVVAQHPFRPWAVITDELPPPGYANVCVRARNVRRIDDRTDHQRSDFTFDSLMGSLKSGVPA